MKIILATFLLLLSNATLADFSAAAKDYANKNYQKAFESFMEMAKLGEKRAQFNLGVMYYSGQYVEQDLAKAYAWTKLATESETLSEQVQKSFKVIAENVADKKRAEETFLEYKNKYGTQALLEKLHPTLINPEDGESFFATPKKIVEPRYPSRAAKRGAQGWVRISFDIDTIGTPRNIKILESAPAGMFDEVTLKAVRQWKFEVELDKDGMPVKQHRKSYTLEYRLRNMSFLSTESKDYKRTLRKAKAGHAQSQFAIGVWQSKLPKLTKDLNPSEWYLKAAIQGHPSAQYLLAESLLNGQGCVKDNQKGFDWLMQAANNNSQDALQLLGTQEASKNTLESHKKALSYFNRLKEQDVYTKLEIARILATSPHAEILNASKSLEIVNNIEETLYVDSITLHEVKGEAYFALGDKKKAVKMFAKALEQAKKFNADTNSIEGRIAELSK